MFQDPFLNNGTGHSDSLFATDGTTLHLFTEVVLHHGNVFIAIWGSFKSAHQVY